jgi:hypothetical protein
MPEITMPEVKLPDVKLPDGLRDMTKDDIVHAVREVKVPKTIKLPDVDLSDIELPDAIADRLPRRRGPNPLLPLLALTIVGMAVVAAWWLFTSATTGPRVRRAVDDLKSRMNSEPSDLVRYDNDADLGSLVSQQETGPATMNDPYAAEASPFVDQIGVPVGPGAYSESAR